ncbi:hypothetical protein ACVIW2_001587 [Bradyrhizobium huanghuaihaiense]|uniref:SnoaL-like protein n=1 Tax=Bradyrhizobium huanghuaihaiense TaxID=990078 RepID=A0A562QZW3_9BRAD|nr:hypothetical protein [Bradyrhizobium huanghuaihaiense]TWI62358.1 hypothetical protein IQ16_06685 [Bradyrhizobium huanghuaihaiense]
MSRPAAITAADAISTYILAKDGNRPQMMTRAFADDCELEMIVKTDAISFPSAAKGLEQVTQVLVTGFGEQYENVRTFCLSRPGGPSAARPLRLAGRNVGEAGRCRSRWLRTL